MRYVVLALALALLSVTPLTAAAADCARTTTGLVPLPELGTGTYKGTQGGLYSGGTNTPPAAYAAEGRRAASEIVPRAPSGQADAAGKVVLLSIGMSNTTQEFAAFVRVAQSDAVRDADVVVVDGAQGGQDARDWSDPKHATWGQVDNRLKKAGVTAAQVQAVWLKQAIARPGGDFPTSSAQLETALAKIIENAKARYPNLAQVFVSPRTYAGYAITDLNPEPYAYETGFAVKRLVERRVREPSARPWIGWGPYLWADGTKARVDGLTWACSDVQNDGVHPGPTGEAKVAQQLQAFFNGSEFTTWYRGEPSGAGSEPARATTPPVADAVAAATQAAVVAANEPMRWMWFGAGVVMLLIALATMLTLRRRRHSS